MSIDFKNIRLACKTEGEIAEYERQQVEEQKHAAYSQCGIGDKYTDCKIEDYTADTEERRSAIEGVKSFIVDVNAGWCPNLWIYGAKGTGKTMLGGLICRETFGKYRTSYRLVEEFRVAGRFGGGENRLEMLDRYTRYRVLVIDEVGKNPAVKEDETAVLWEILNERYSNSRPSVIISNLDKLDLARYIGDHLTDRFAETGRSIGFSGASYRAELRKTNLRGTGK